MLLSQTHVFLVLLHAKPVPQSMYALFAKMAISLQVVPVYFVQKLPLIPIALIALVWELVSNVKLDISLILMENVYPASQAALLVWGRLSTNV